MSRVIHPVLLSLGIIAGASFGNWLKEKVVQEATPKVYVLTKSVDYEGERSIGVFRSLESAQQGAKLHAIEYGIEAEPAWSIDIHRPIVQWNWRIYDSADYIIRAEPIR